MNFTYEERDVPGAIPIYVNSSALKLASCRRRFALTLAGYAPPEPADSAEILRTGNAIHKFAEEFTRNGGDIADAISVASRAYPDVPRQTLINVGSTRMRVRIAPPITMNGKPAVEVKFRLPWYTFTYNGKVYQVVLCGTIDHIAFDQGLITIYDYKSTRKRQADYALKKYEHSSQFAFYQWILYKFAARVGLPIEYANLVRQGRISSRVVPVLITAKEPLWVIGPTRSLTPDQFQTYEDTFMRVVFTDLIPAALEVIDPIDTSESAIAAPADGIVNDSCQYCIFHKYCYATNTAESYKVIESYPRKQYDPLNRHESLDE